VTVGRQRKRLSDIAAINYGYTESASSERVGPKFLRITDIQDGAVDWASVPYCPIDAAALAKFRLAHGDIVFARTGATTGKSYFVQEPPDAVFASYLIRLRLTTTDILPQFPNLFFQSSDYWREIQAGSTGSAQSGFNASKLGKLEVQCPTIVDQRRIVAKVNEVDGATGATSPAQASPAISTQGGTETSDEALRKAPAAITGTLAADLLDRVRKATPVFFEKLIVELLLAMGYGGTSEEAGRALGQSGDDGVIDQDPLGVDQIFVQAKRYAEGNNISAGAIRDFYGALSLKKAHKGIFVTTSAFSQPAIDAARGLGSRIVLIDGLQLSRLMIRYNVGCRDEDVLHLKQVDEDFFEG